MLLWALGELYISLAIDNSLWMFNVADDGCDKLDWLNFINKFDDSLVGH